MTLAVQSLEFGHGRIQTLMIGELYSDTNVSLYLDTNVSLYVDTNVSSY